MPNTVLTITIDPGGVSVAVNITQPSSLSFTAYTTRDGSTPVTFPVTISRRTVFYMDTAHRYNVSLVGPSGENADGSGGVAALDLRGGQNASLGYVSTAGKGTYSSYVVHGSTAGTSRPTSTGPVLWIGSVTPTNATAGDEWRDTTTDPYTVKIRGASTFTQVGGTSVALTPTAIKTGAYTVAVGEIAMMNVAGGATALALPAAPADKAQVAYRAIGATTAVPLVVTRGGSDTIGLSGATSTTVPLADEVVVLQYQAASTRWLAVANVKTQTSLDTRYASVTSAWTTGRAYAVGELVTSGGSLYKVATAHTSAGSFDATKFDAIGAGINSPLLTGVDYWSAGNSYAASYLASNNIGFTARVTKALNLTSRGTGLTLGGTYMSEIGLLTSCHLSGGWGTGLVSIHGVINDVNGDSADSTKMRKGFQNGLTLAIANARARAIYSPYTAAFYYGAGADVGNGSFAMSLTGTWANDFTIPKNGSYTPSDGGKTTSTNGSYADITLNGKECVIVVSGYDTAVSAVTPATYTVTQGGTTLVTGTTADQFRTNPTNPTAAATSGSHMPIPIKVTCPSAGPNTIRITNTNGGKLNIWYVLIPYEVGVYTYKPKTCVVFKQGYLPTGGYGGSGATDATVDLYNGLIDTVIATFGVPAEELFSLAPTNWNKATMTAPDNLHPNDLGYANIATTLLTALSALPYRVGLSS